MKQDFASILNEVQATLGQRGKDRDVEQERSITAIREIYYAISGKNTVDTDADGWMWMMAVKLGRMRIKIRKDDLIDLIGYSTLFAEEVLNYVLEPEEEAIDETDTHRTTPEGYSYRVDCKCEWCTTLQAGKAPSPEMIKERELGERLAQAMGLIPKQPSPIGIDSGDEMYELVEKLRTGELTGGFVDREAGMYSFFNVKGIATQEDIDNFSSNVRDMFPGIQECTNDIFIAHLVRTANTRIKIH